MKTASTSVFIDKYHPNKAGLCKVSIRITYNRKKRYYATDLMLEVDVFEKAINSKRKTEVQKGIYSKIDSFESKALNIIKSLNSFTFNKFEELYFTNRDSTDSIAFAFDKYIKELTLENRIGTAVSYQSAINSIESFQAGLKFADIDKAKLMKYENWMLKNGKSKATIGIYLRSLRTIYNTAKIDKSNYPFGSTNSKYTIPTGKNTKKALTLEEVSMIFNYKAEAKSKLEMAKDYWIFMYLCNGMNIKDLCLLKYKNIDGDVLRYQRAKTKRSKQDEEMIVVSLKKETKKIISKWGQKSISPDSYIFPHLINGLTSVREREIYQQLTKTINKYIKRIAKELLINKEITTYFARHSFATILKNSGVSVEFISEMLGHGDVKTTKSYLAGFETETIHKTTDALTAFDKF